MRCRQLADGPFWGRSEWRFLLAVMLVARLSRGEAPGSTAPVVVGLLVGTGRCWSARVRQSFEPVEGVCEDAGPGPVFGEAEDAAASGGDSLGGGGERPQAEPSGFPGPGRAGQRQHRHPGQQVKRDPDDLQPDPVLCGLVQGEVAQAGGADAVLGAGTFRVFAQPSDRPPRESASQGFGDGAGSGAASTGVRQPSWSSGAVAPDRRPGFVEGHECSPPARPHPTARTVHGT